MNNPLAEDLEMILDHTSDMWQELRGERIFITGGTGFFGCWLLESFCWINRRLSLGASAVVLTRNPKAFATKAPHLAVDAAVSLHAGDVRNFDFPEGSFSHVIHAATEASAKLNEENPLLMFDTIVEGTRRTLDFALSCGAGKFLLTSSGAVYGPQPHDLTHVPETCGLGPECATPAASYAEGKRVAELLCAIYSAGHRIEAKIARCFAFVGPYLPLDAHFAAGNFLRDELSGGPIRVNGDGTPRRSYLYAADLTIWLWTILFRGQPSRPYNVGSDADITISELAGLAAGLSSGITVQIARTPRPDTKPARYVPDISRARAELNLSPLVPLAEGLRRTSEWARRKVTV